MSASSPVPAAHALHAPLQPRDGPARPQLEAEGGVAGGGVQQRPARPAQPRLVLQRQPVARARPPHAVHRCLHLHKCIGVYSLGNVEPK